MQSKIAHAAERKAFSVALDAIIHAASGSEREKRIDQFIDLAGKLLKDTSPGVTRGLRAGRASHRGRCLSAACRPSR